MDSNEIKDFASKYTVYQELETQGEKIYFENLVEELLSIQEMLHDKEYFKDSYCIFLNMINGEVNTNEYPC